VLVLGDVLGRKLPGRLLLLVPAVIPQSVKNETSDDKNNSSDVTPSTISRDKIRSCTWW
jgi:hypothetical protein